MEGAGMIYDIKHVTTCHYEWPNASSRFAMRLMPLNTPHQKLLSSFLHIEPHADVLTQRTDFFGTRVDVATITQSHQDLKLTALARLSIDYPTAPVAGLTPQWEHVKHDIFTAQNLATDAPVHYLYPSPLTPLNAAITAYAVQSFSPQRPILEAGVDLMKRIHSDFKYAPLSTDVSTPIAHAFSAREGVCQDFAHIMIAGLRGLGLSAAYVSGYLRTIPPAGQKRLEGVDAMHAWISLWCGPAFGWIDLDPTNAIITENHHITVARGRDYTDVSPIDGIVIGLGKQTMKVAVDVIEVV
jgi:transglutaminase-like putative cysteine protease